MAELFLFEMRHKIVLLLAAATSLAIFFSFILKGYVFLHPDSFIYHSIADSLLAGNGFRNVTSLPSTGPPTTQNGAVGVQLLLASLGLGDLARINVFAGLNYSLYLAALWPLIKLAQGAGIRDANGLTCLATIYLVPFHILFFQLIPFQDGIFNAGSVILLFLIWQAIDGSYTENSRKWLYLRIALLIIFLVHFRHQVVLVVIGGVIVSFIVNQRRLAGFLTFTVVAALGSVAIIYQFVDRSVMSSHWTKILGFMPVPGRPDGVLTPFLNLGKVLSELLYYHFDGDPLRGDIIYVVFALALAAATCIAFRQKKVVLMLVTSTIILGILFQWAFSVRLVRYNVFYFGFFYLILIWVTWTRPFSYLFAGMIWVSSLISLIQGPSLAAHESVLSAINKQRGALVGPQDLLITLGNTALYYSLGKGALRYADLSWADIEKSKFTVLGTTKPKKALKLFREVDAIAVVANVRLICRDQFREHRGPQGVVLRFTKEELRAETYSRQISKKFSLSKNEESKILAIFAGFRARINKILTTRSGYRTDKFADTSTELINPLARPFSEVFPNWSFQSYPVSPKHWFMLGGEVYPFEGTKIQMLKDIETAFADRDRDVEEMLGSSRRAAFRKFSFKYIWGRCDN